MDAFELEMDRKRKINQSHSTKFGDDLDVDLALSLSPPSRRPRPPPPPPPPLPPFAPGEGAQSSLPLPRSNRTRRNSSQAPRPGRDEHISPPFEWATDCRATIYSLDYLSERGIRTISGEVVCKRCEAHDIINYDLETKFTEVGTYISMRKDTMHQRAPKEWMSPILPDCASCRQADCMKPVISAKKRSINWLFLLLGQMLGCCTLDQLKYFCKHTKNHRTGAKDRVLYLTYLGLCKQLDPNGPFDR